MEDTISPPDANNTVVDAAAEVFYGPVTDVVNNKIYDGPTGEVIHYSTDSPIFRWCGTCSFVTD